MSSSFFERVYDVVRRVPPGRVVTYGQVARLLEAPHAARTVGWALAPLQDRTVPWHRVVNTRGAISGRRQERVARQRELLEAEGLIFDERGRINLDRYRWCPPPSLIDQLMGHVEGEEERIRSEPSIGG